MSKTQIVCSEAELEPMLLRINEAARSAVESVVELSAIAAPLDLLRTIKFQKLGFDPLAHSRLNLIEQVNQTFTYVATIDALRYLFRKHSAASPFIVNLGTASGHDIASNDGSVVAEVFAAVSPESNDKLKKDVCKLAAVVANHRYVFCSCPGIDPGDLPSRPECPQVKIVSLGVTREGAIRCTDVLGLTT